MLSEDSRKILVALATNGRAITDLTPEEAKVLSQDFKAAAKIIEIEKMKAKEARVSKSQNNRTQGKDDGNVKRRFKNNRTQGKSDSSMDR